MKQKIDFIIKEDDSKRIIFRFYPRRSHCHSFNDIPPKNWDEVYKVYYHYSILLQHKKITNVDKVQYCTETLFESLTDECSVIDAFANVCKLVSSDSFKIKKPNDKFEQLLFDEFTPHGNGVSWRILDVASHDNPFYEIQLFNHLHRGYRFYMHPSQLKCFAEYLLSCCEYMLAHGESI